MRFSSIQELIDLAQEKNVEMSQIVLDYEINVKGKEEEAIKKEMLRTWDVMKDGIVEGIERPQKSMGGLIGGDGQKIEQYIKHNKTLSGDLMVQASARALAVSEVNASMGRVVACPTAGSCGILPAVLVTVQERLGLSDERIVDGLLTASGIGIIIANKACIAGAVGGCQAECGSAAAMASAAIVELAGGTPEQAGHAAAMVLKNVLGLVCDPVAGLVEVPCAKRNVLGTSLALVSADLALAGVESKIPVDEVIAAMDEVGRGLPSALRETALGGLATTPTGIRLANEILGKTNHEVIKEC